MTFFNWFTRMLHLIWLSMNHKLCHGKHVLQGYFLRAMVVEIMEKKFGDHTWWSHRGLCVNTPSTRYPVDIYRPSLECMISQENPVNIYWTVVFPETKVAPDGIYGSEDFERYRRVCTLTAKSWRINWIEAVPAMLQQLRMSRWMKQGRRSVSSSDLRADPFCCSCDLWSDWQRWMGTFPLSCTVGSSFKCTDALLPTVHGRSMSYCKYLRH
jgi:hypothetical protein